MRRWIEGLETFAIDVILERRAGKRADLAIWRAREPAELCYWLGGDLLTTLVKDGKVVATGARDEVGGSHDPAVCG